METAIPNTRKATGGMINGLMAGLVGLALLLTVFGTGSEMLTAWPGLFALVLATLLFFLRTGSLAANKSSALCFWSVLAFAGYTFWRGMNSDVAWLARFDLLFLVAGLSSYFLAAAVLRNSRECLTVIHIVLLGLLANAVCALIQKFGNPTWSLHGSLAGALPELGRMLGWTGMHRKVAGGEVSAMFASENHFAGYLCCLGFLPLSLAVLGGRGRWTWLYAALFLLTTLGVVLAASRGGMLAFGVGCLVFLTLALLARRANKAEVRKPKRGLVVLMILAILAAGAGGWAVLSREYKAGVFQNMSMREIHWRSAFEQFLLNPLTGTGARSFEYYERSFRSLDSGHWFYWSREETDAYFAHGDWHQALADYGALGVLLAAIALFLHFRCSTRTITSVEAQRDRLAVAIHVGALSGIAAAAAHAVFEFNMHIFAIVVAVGFLLGLLARRDGIASARPTMNSRLAGLVLRAAVVCAALWVVIMGRDWWKAEILSASAERNMQTDEYEKSVALVKQIRELDPENYFAPFIHGALDYGEAIRIQPEQIADTPELKAQKSLMRQMRAGFLKSAAAHFQDVYRLYPQNPHYSRYYAEVLSLLGRWDEADEIIRQALKWGHGIRTVRTTAADILLRKAIATSDEQERVAFLKEAIQHYQEVGGRYGMGSDESKDLLAKIQGAEAWLRDPKAALPSPVLVPAP